MVRLWSGALVFLLLAATLLADEYKGATIKKLDKENKDGNVVLTVKSQDVRVLASPTIYYKAFDSNGEELKGFGANAKVLREGNVVDVKTEKKGKREIVREIRLIKGKLAP